MASKEFQFHYVKTPTGSISGQSVLTQTEDAINDLGDYMVEVAGDATEALNKATEALNTANTAQQNAVEALSTANSALGSVNTLTVIVNSWDGRIKKAESNAANAVTAATEASNNASQAVTTANSALNSAQQAVTTANAAKTTAQNASISATQAVGTANAANATAEEAKKIAQQAAKKIAQQAGINTDGFREEINADMETINQQVAAATAQAQAAQSAAVQAQGYAKVAAFEVRLTSANMSASGTAALSSLTPQTNIKVGDTVIDPDGKVFQIASLASSTFTVGEEFTSIQGPRGEKGDVGINYTTTATDDVTAGTTALETGHFIFIYEK
jgi:hypothetical protein